MAAPHPDFPVELNARKAALRAWALGVRAGLDPGAGEAVVPHVLARALPEVVAGFWPLPGEIDLRGLWGALHARGHVVLLPETRPLGQALVFRVWSPGVAMVAGRFGTLWPDGPVAAPGLIGVPFLAFDRAGRRLGYGGGYYDRTLAAWPGVPAVGLGFSALMVDSVPVGPHDRPLDAVITECGVAAPELPEA